MREFKFDPTRDEQDKKNLRTLAAHRKKLWVRHVGRQSLQTADADCECCCCLPACCRTS